MAQRRSFNREFLVICVTKEYPLMVAKNQTIEKNIAVNLSRQLVSRRNCQELSDLL